MSFITQALKNPTAVGTLIPSSRRFSRFIAEHAGIRTGDIVVEIGPGTGAITGELLGLVGDGGSYLGVEINAEFVASLREMFPRADFVNGSAEHIGRYLRERGRQGCDVVVSGLPWTNMRPALQRELLSAIAGALRPGGRFITYGYFPLNRLPRGRAFRRLLNEMFSDSREVRMLTNFPPSYAYACTK